MNKQKILITGSCGSVMGNFIRKVIYDKLPYSIVSIDNCNNANYNSYYWNTNHKFYIANINDAQVLDTIFKFEQPEIVIHGAGLVGNEASFVNSQSFLQTNVIGTQNLIQACKNHRVSKLVYLSSDAVYGELNPSQLDKAWTEQDATNPLSPYAISKVAAEHLISTSGLTFNILRLSSSYGTYQSTDKLIPKLIKSFYNNTPITLWGKGDQTREWTHIFDFISALLTVLQKGVNNQIYNVSAQQELPSIAVAQKICSLMKKDLSLVSCQADPHQHVFRRAMDASKLRAVGWKSSFAFKNGIEETLNWYLANQWTLKS